jgi:hypothetical protein
MAVTLNASTSSGLVQTADTSGTVEIQSNGTTRLTVASGGVTTTGNTSIANLTATGNTSIANLTATGTFGGGVITSGTAVASTSGTSIDFTGIPSWVKRITVLFSGVSASGTSNLLIQIGSGSFNTSGYVSGATSNVATGSTIGFILTSSNAAAYAANGQVMISSFGSNVWTSAGNLNPNSTNSVNASAGLSPTLSGTLDRVRITTVNGTDTFDAGSINILYEG